MATSDEQRAAWIGEAMRLHYVAVALRWPPPKATNREAWHEYERKLNGANAALRAYLDTAQQAPQERADLRPLPKVNIAIVYRFLGSEKHAAIYSTNWKDGIDINVPAFGLQALVEFYVAQDRMRALAANPQQSNGAVEKPTKEPDAAIGASQVPEGVANAERSAMQLCPSTNPQIAPETKERKHGDA